MIFKSLKINKKKLKNRIAISPMCQYSATKGSPSNWHYKHLSSLVCSGAAMLIIESTAVSKGGRITEKDLCLQNDKQYKDLKKLIKFLKSLNNIPILIQLSHSGKKGSSYVPWIKSNTPLKHNSWKTLSSSKIKKDKNWPTPKEASKKEINQLIKDFYKSAKYAKKAGLDGVEIHMAHGYLLHQFLSPISNHRKDRYGGTNDNRNILPLEITKKLKKITKNDLILGARVTGLDHIKKGIGLKQSIDFINKLKKAGLNYVCVSSGGIKTKTGLNPKKRGIRALVTKKIKNKIDNLVIGTTGNLSDLNYLNRILENKFLDLAFIGRPFLKNPNWLFKYALKNNREDLISNQYRRAL